MTEGNDFLVEWLVEIALKILDFSPIIKGVKHKYIMGTVRLNLFYAPMPDVTTRDPDAILEYVSKPPAYFSNLMDFKHPQNP